MSTNAVRDHNQLQEICDMCEKILDIKHVTPSEYVYPAGILAEARSELNSDIHKSHKLTQKALEAYRKESAIYAKYKPIEDSMNSVNNANASDLFFKALRSGDYSKADSIITKISATSKPEKTILAAYREKDTGNVVVVNNGDEKVWVKSVVVEDKDTRYSQSKRDVTIQSHDIMKVDFPDSYPSPLNLSVFYLYKGKEGTYNAIVGDRR